MHVIYNLVIQFNVKHIVGTLKLGHPLLLYKDTVPA
jgi:hypothetical protein